MSRGVLISRRYRKLVAILFRASSLMRGIVCGAMTVFDTPACQVSRVLGAGRVNSIR